MSFQDSDSTLLERNLNAIRNAYEYTLQKKINELRRAKIQTALLEARVLFLEDETDFVRSQQSLVVERLRRDISHKESQIRLFQTKLTQTIPSLGTASTGRLYEHEQDPEKLKMLIEAREDQIERLVADLETMTQQAASQLRAAEAQAASSESLRTDMARLRADLSSSLEREVVLKSRCSELERKLENDHHFKGYEGLDTLFEATGRIESLLANLHQAHETQRSQDLHVRPTRSSALFPRRRLLFVPDVDAPPEPKFFTNPSRLKNDSQEGQDEVAACSSPPLVKMRLLDAFLSMEPVSSDQTGSQRRASFVKGVVTGEVMGRRESGWEGIRSSLENGSGRDAVESGVQAVAETPTLPKSCSDPLVFAAGGVGEYLGHIPLGTLTGAWLVAEEKVHARGGEGGVLQDEIKRSLEGEIFDSF